MSNYGRDRQYLDSASVLSVANKQVNIAVDINNNLNQIENLLLQIKSGTSKLKEIYELNGLITEAKNIFGDTAERYRAALSKMIDETEIMENSFYRDLSEYGLGVKVADQFSIRGDGNNQGKNTAFGNNNNQAVQQIHGDGNYQAGRDQYINNEYVKEAAAAAGIVPAAVAATPSAPSGPASVPSTGSSSSSSIPNCPGKKIPNCPGKTPEPTPTPTPTPTPEPKPNPYPNKPAIDRPKAEGGSNIKIGPVAGGASMAKVNVANQVSGGGGGGGSSVRYGGPVYNVQAPKGTTTAAKGPSVSKAPARKPLKVDSGATVKGPTTAIADNGSNAVAQTGLINDNSHDVVGSIIGDFDDHSIMDSSGNLASQNTHTASDLSKKAGLGLLGAAGLGGLAYGVYRGNEKDKEEAFPLD